MDAYIISCKRKPNFLVTFLKVLQNPKISSKPKYPFLLLVLASR